MKNAARNSFERSWEIRSTDSIVFCRHWYSFLSSCECRVRWIPRESISKWYYREEAVEILSVHLLLTKTRCCLFLSFSFVNPSFVSNEDVFGWDSFHTNLSIRLRKRRWIWHVSRVKLVAKAYEILTNIVSLRFSSMAYIVGLESVLKITINSFYVSKKKQNIIYNLAVSIHWCFVLCTWCIYIASKFNT